MSYRFNVKKWATVAAIVGLAVAFAGIEARAAVVIVAQADAALDERSSTTPNGSGVKLNLRSRNDSTTRYESMLLRFDISTLTAPLSNIALNLTGNDNISGFSLNYFGLYEAQAGAWNEATVTYGFKDNDPSTWAPGHFPDSTSATTTNLNTETGSNLQKWDLVPAGQPDTAAVVTSLGNLSFSMSINGIISFNNDNLLSFVNTAIANGDDSVTFAVKRGISTGQSLGGVYSREATDDLGVAGVDTLVTDLMRPSLVIMPDITWNNAAGGDWATAANWNPNIIPNEIGAIVHFTNPLTSGTVQLNDARTVGKMEFNSASNYTIDGSGTLTLDSSSSVPINVLSGNHTIAAGISIVDATTVTVSPGSSLTMGGPVSSVHTLYANVGSGGAFNLSGPVNTTSSLIINVTGTGTANISSNFSSVKSITPTVASGGTFTFSGSATATGALALNVATGGTATISGSITGLTGVTATVAPGATVTLSGNLGGAGGITKSGEGPLVISGDNSSLAGANSFLHGIVTIRSSNALGNGSNTTQVRTRSDLTETGQLILDGQAAPGGGIIVPGTIQTSGSGVIPNWYHGQGGIHNESGNNELSGNIQSWSASIGAMFSVADGSLTLSGPLTNYADNGLRTFIFSADAGKNGKVKFGGVNDSATNRYVGMMKVGAGTWTIEDAACSASGPTDIYEGILALSGTGSISNSRIVAVRGGATLDVSAETLYNNKTIGLVSAQTLMGTGTINGAVQSAFGATISPSAPASVAYSFASGSTTASVNLPAGTMTILGNGLGSGGLTLAGYDTLAFKLTSNTAGSDKIDLQDDLVFGFSNTKVLIVPGGGALNTSVNYPIIVTSGVQSSSGVSLEIDPNHNSRYTYALVNASGGNWAVDVGGANKTLTWTGGANSKWNSVAWDGFSSYAGGESSWQGAVANDEVFYQGDAVIFDDTYTGTSNVELAGTLYPASITVSGTRDYVIAGTGRISGGAGIVKNGTGTLTVANLISTGPNNDFTGDVVIRGGVFKPIDTLAFGSYFYGKTVIENDGDGDAGTLDLNGVASLVSEHFEASGDGHLGLGAIVNNGAADGKIANLELTGHVRLGGTRRWDLDGNHLSGQWDAGYLHGNGKNLTKVGANEVHLIALGETNLGDVNVSEGYLFLEGNTTLGNSANAINLNTAGRLILAGTVATHAKRLNTGAAGGTLEARVDSTLASATAGDLAGMLSTYVTDGKTLTLDAKLSGVGGVTKSAYLGYTGTLVLGGDNDYQGPTVIEAGAGALVLAATGNISPLSPITNDDKFQIAGGTHLLGTIGGGGTMSVLGTSVVTATSISQGTLSIGGGTAAAVPEPATWILILAGAISACGFRKIRNRW